MIITLKCIISSHYDFFKLNFLGQSGKRKQMTGIGTKSALRAYRKITDEVQG